MDGFDLPSEVEIVAGNQVVIRTESLVATQPEPSASPSATPSGSPTASPSATGSASPTASPSSTTSPSASPAEGPSPTPQPSASATSGAGTGASPSASATPTPSPSPTATTSTSRETVLLLNALAKEAGIQPEEISVTDVGPTWGGTISRKALIGLIVFLLLVSVYISLRFEPKMAISALVAVGHDLIITAGVFALTGREVSPETVVAILTILGYSLYDTVVIFDKIKENTESVALVSRETYSGVVDISLNQTLMRSVNTSLVVLLPIGALLLFGGETLKDFAFALFVGVAAGTYSSIFVASPLLAMLKEREPRYQQIRARVESKGRPPLRVVGSSSRALGPRRRQRGARAGGQLPRADEHDDRPGPAEAFGVRGREPQEEGQAPGPAASRAAAEPRREEAWTCSTSSGAHPGHPGLPAAGRGVQGHHPAAGR